MNFDNDEDLMKAIMGGGGAGGGDIDDELAALENEVNGPSKKKGGDGDGLSDLEAELEEEGKGKGKSKKKNDSDDELAKLEKEGLDEEDEKPKTKVKQKNASDDELDALEKEGLDDVDEEEKPKAQKKPEAKQSQAKPQPPPQTKPQPQPKKEVPKGPDLYPEKTEKKYHTVEKMTSLGVLEKEKEICDKIIAYKKEIGADYDDWDIKKESIDDKIGSITSFVQDGIWDLNKYKAEILNQFKWEGKLLQFVDKDPSLNDQQKKILKERVQNRQKIIEDELKKNPEEQENEEPTKEQTKKEEPKKQEPKKETTPTQKGPDLYPEKTEKKYHSVEKMTSLGVLEKEKEICDKIIAYKKEIGADYDDWDIKKESIDDKIGSITSFVQDGLWDLNKYKAEIANQFKWENKLLMFVDKDPSLNDQQKKILKERVQDRQNIIKEEMKQNQEGEEEEEKPKEEVKKVEKEPPKKEIVETKKSLSPMYSVPKDKEEEEKNRLNKVVIDRLNEYRAALEYFQNNELGEQRVDANNKAKLICIELKKIQDGKWREVNEFKLPDPVTPEYIYGYKKEERLERFKKVIMDYDRQRKEHTALLNAKVEALKKIPAQKLKKMKDAVTKDLNEMKAKKEKFDKIINLLKEKLQDSWVPAPLFIEQDKEIKTEIINKDVPEFHLRIIFGKTTYSKDKSLYLVVTHKEKNHEKKFDQKAPGDWEQTFDWKYDKAEFKSLFRAKIHVDIYEKRLILKDTFKGSFDMEPKELKDHAEITKEFPITLESGRAGQKAEVTFKVHQACKEPEYKVETKSFLQVTKIYPAFNLKGGNSSQAAIKINVNTAQVSAQDLSVNNSTQGQTMTSKQGGKPVSKPQGQAQKPKVAPGTKPGAGPKKPGQPSAPIDKSQFKDEELKDPDCIESLNTLMVLQFKQNKYEEIRNKIDGRTPRELMQRIIKIKCKIQSLENSLGDDISPQDYSNLLRVTFEHDKKLAEYFKQTGDKEKFILVNERLPLIFKELEELTKQMPKK